MAKHSIGVVLGSEAKKMVTRDNLEYFLNNLSEILSEHDDKHNKIRPDGVLNEISKEWEAYMSEKMGMNYMRIIHPELASVSLWDKAQNGSIQFDALSSEKIISSLYKEDSIVRSKQ
jgi:hypothetical protein